MRMRTWSILLTFLVSILSAPSPIEQYFFELPLVEWLTLQIEDSSLLNPLLNNFFDYAVNTRELLGGRVLQPYQNNSLPPQPNQPLNESVVVVMQIFPSVSSYINRKFYFPEPNNFGYTVLSREAFQKITDFGGCKYCPSSPQFEAPEHPILGQFDNSQSGSTYPLQTTFTNTLDVTAAQAGTLDYVMAQKLFNPPTEQVISYNFDVISFFELYSSSEAFDLHVKVVNDTLKPLGPSWFVGLKTLRASWFFVRNYTYGCNMCIEASSGASKNDVKFWRQWI
eukprot:TRINITY_DN1567_c0_g1_i4.p1 TRINITY_DN1567_c0_g1~~TRINITY_DN1567_c0_g1_i4.p1  ORF type:complete len:281 (+),score=39.45 TRINITY_DN1567_c0_g1_i4:112-954(+)